MLKNEETEKIREHYDADPKKEWDRLQVRFPVEKYITTHMMDRYIRPGECILDKNVRFAKKKARQYGVKIDAMQGNATDLSGFADDSFDIVFLMGPLYHLMTEETRIRAIREAARVLKPGGYLFCSYILMFGGVIYGLRELQETILSPKEQILFDVAAEDKSLSFEAFTYAYMTTVKDAKALMRHIRGLTTETIFGQESILAPYKNELKNSSKKVREAWFEYALRYCEKDEYLTHSEHLMIVSRKG